MILVDEESLRYVYHDAIRIPDQEVPLVYYAADGERVLVGSGIITEDEYGLKITGSITDPEAAQNIGVGYEPGRYSVIPESNKLKMNPSDYREV